MQQSSKKYISLAFVSVILLLGITFFHSVGFAKPLIDLPKVDGMEHIENSGNTSFLGFLTKDNGLINTIKIVLGAVAIAFMIFYGIQMVFAQGKDETISKSKQGITYALVGLVVLNAGGAVVDFFNPVKDTSLTMDEGRRIVGTIITGLRYLIGAIAVFFIVISGFRMVTAGGKEDVINKNKTQIMWSIMGLMLVAMAGSFVDIFYGAKTDVSPIMSIANLMLMFVVPVGVIFLLMGGFYMITARGNETMLNKGKKIVQATIIALVIIYSCYTIIAEVLKFSTTS